jgi:hypothetical protein
MATGVVSSDGAQGQRPKSQQTLRLLANPWTQDHPIQELLGICAVDFCMFLIALALACQPVLVQVGPSCRDLCLGLETEMLIFKMLQSGQALVGRRLGYPRI